jgi:hypothetical protein
MPTILLVGAICATFLANLPTDATIIVRPAQAEYQVEPPTNPSPGPTDPTPKPSGPIPPPRPPVPTPNPSHPLPLVASYLYEHARCPAMNDCITH